MLQLEECLSFDDILIVPNKSEILPSKTSLATGLTKNLKLNIPFVSAAMDTVTTSKMAIAMALNGGVGAIHKNCTIEKQSQEIIKVKTHSISQNNTKKNVAALDKLGKLLVIGVVGTKDEDLTRSTKLINAGADALIVDTAHGHSVMVAQMVEKLKKIHSDTPIIAGNIVTQEAARDLINAGADGVKVGVGPGSICTTRIVAGVGLPQFSAIHSVAQVCQQYNISLIADGGIRSSGDAAKAIAAGADSVMIGSMFAGTDESPMEIISLNGQKYKLYRGMGSLGAMQDGSADRYFQKNYENDQNKRDQDNSNENSANYSNVDYSNHTKQKIKFVPEGVEGMIHYRGPLADTLEQLCGGLRASLGYTGNKDIYSMKKNCKFVKITNAGVRESHVHDIDFFKNAPNYQKN